MEIPAYLIGMFVVEYFGRRLTLNVALLAGGCFCLIAGLVPQSNEHQLFVKIINILLMFAIQQDTMVLSFYSRYVASFLYRCNW